MDVRHQLRLLGVKPSKDLGQNFLTEPYVVEEIINFAGLSATDNLLEIGPGLGVMTAELLAVAPLTVIEIETAFAEYLGKKFPKLNVIHEDVRYVDFTELGDELVVMGNLPYSFSSEIIFHLIAFSKHVKRAVLMLQKEYAQRLASPPGRKSYGALTVFTQIKAEASLGPIFPGNCFFPPPKVDSQVIELRFNQEDRHPLKDELFFKQLVIDLFKGRRKKISNLLKLQQEKIEFDLDKLFEDLSLSPERRPEDLAVQDFVNLANYLSDFKA